MTVVPVSRVIGRRPVLLALRGGHAVEAPEAVRDRLERRLLRLFRPAFGSGTTVVTRSFPDAGATVAIVDEQPGRDGIADLLAWGEPVGRRPPDAADDEIAAAADTTAARRSLLGSYVLADARGGDALTLHTGGDIVHTLWRCTGPDGDAFATSGLAAAVAAGGRLRVVPERIVEFGLFDFVFGDDHLLDGVHLLSEASTVRITAEASTVTSWWPVADRLRGDPSSVDDLLTVLTPTVVATFAGDGVSLGLTSGRDSSLVAGVLAAAGGSTDTFTMGAAGQPDVVGAVAVARQLGWTHRVVPPARRAQPSLERLLNQTRLSEGMDTAWNFYGSPLQWPDEVGPVLVGGVGGEMGRAFFWSTITDPELLADPADAISRWHLDRLGPQGADVLRARCGWYAQQLYDDGWRGTAVLDAWHARGRVRKWVAATPPTPGRRLRTVYTNAAVARALLNLPAAARVDSSGFDEAGRRAGDLRRIASRAVAQLPAPGPLQRSRVGRRLRRTLHSDPGVDWAFRCLRELGGTPLLADVLGADAWAAELRAVKARRRSSHLLWNALAVEALARVAEQVRQER